MKLQIIVILMVFSLLGLNTDREQSIAQIKSTEQSIKNNGKYALLVSKVQHLKPAIITGKSFKAKNSKVDFQIVTCGELVREIANDQELQKLEQQ